MNTTPEKVPEEMTGPATLQGEAVTDETIAELTDGEGDGGDE